MDNFKEKINSNKLVLVDFFANWCGPCKAMHPVIENVTKEMGDSIAVIKIDIDKYESLASLYNVQSVPTFMLIKEGKVIWRQSGTLSQSALLQLIRQHL
ncbi:MAG: thioredoxin [Prevotellaceae bacterium]|nr:thioredoxin [Prevotellaceae bacterium]